LSPVAAFALAPAGIPAAVVTSVALPLFTSLIALPFVPGRTVPVIVSVMLATSSGAEKHRQSQRRDHNHDCLQMSHTKLHS
jgi:hypothetical protein